jgi:hypothetical protein
VNTRSLRVGWLEVRGASLRIAGALREDAAGAECAPPPTPPARAAGAPPPPPGPGRPCPSSPLAIPASSMSPAAVAKVRLMPPFMEHPL